MSEVMGILVDWEKLSVLASNGELKEQRRITFEKWSMGVVLEPGVADQTSGARIIVVRAIGGTLLEIPLREGETRVQVFPGPPPVQTLVVLAKEAWPEDFVEFSAVSEISGWSMGRHTHPTDRKLFKLHELHNGFKVSCGEGKNGLTRFNPVELRWQ